MFIEEQGEGHIKDRLYIYWDVTTRCNYNCSYCYSRPKYLKISSWQCNANVKKQQLVLSAIKLSTLPVYLGLHGGEPTLHHDYENFIQQTLRSLVRPLDQLYIATNASPKILKTPDSNKIRVLASFHPEFASAERFVKTVKALCTRFKVKVNVLLHPDPKYRNSLHKVYNDCLALGIKVHPHFIYDCSHGGEVLWDYSQQFYDEFSYMINANCWYEFKDHNNIVTKVSDLELFKNNMNNFFNWNCYNNNYEILLDGVLHKICSSEFIDLTKNPLALRNITSINPMKCPFKQCLSDGVLKCLKTYPQSREH